MNQEKNLVLKELLKTKGLCPSCEIELNINNYGEIYQFSNKSEKITYLICKNCLKKINKSRTEKKVSIFRKIEVKLNENLRLYAAIIEHIEKPVMGKLKEIEESAIAELPVNNPWNEDDRSYFINNPDKNYRARKIYPGELEETYDNNEELKNAAKTQNITTAIVHKISDEQRIRSYVNSLDGYPSDDEDFIAALFQILINDFLTLNDLDNLYKEIKRRNSLVKEAVNEYRKTLNK